jgi:hypothetical protein
MLGKAKPDTENIKDLNGAVVRRVPVQIIKLVLQSELLLIGHYQLCKDWTKSKPTICIVHILILDISCNNMQIN